MAGRLKELLQAATPARPVVQKEKPQLVLYHCIYSSVQTRPLSETEIEGLVRHSRESNKAHGLTGVLLHVDNTFFQVLEGDPEVIEDLYTKILRDPRHNHITRIIFEPIPRRFFADSSMSITRLSSQELEDMLDSHDPSTREHLLAGLDEGRAKRLLRAFSEGRWRARATTEEAPSRAVPA